MVQPTYLNNLVQGSDEWLKARLGCITASGIKTLFVQPKDPVEIYGKGGWTYIRNKVKETIFGDIKHMKSDATEWGHEHEPTARKLFEMRTGKNVVEVGFVKIADSVGCSPDGLIDSDGLVEIKCPYNQSVHEGYIKKNEAPKDYLYQMLHQLYVTRRSYVWFVSYDPRKDNLFTKRYELDNLLALLGETKELYDLRIKQTALIIEQMVTTSKHILEEMAFHTIGTGQDSTPEEWD